jgi:hypothetical protein
MSKGGTMWWRGVASLLATLAIGTTWAIGATWAICATWSASAGAATLTGSLTADDAFVVYISKSSSELGRLIAQGNDWAVTYSLPSISLAPGTYYLNIEVTNYGGPGGLIGDFTVGGRHLLTDTTDWFANRNPGFERPGPWAAATGRVISQGLNGVAPWGRHPGINANAQWIDAVRGLSSCGVCTVDFSAKITVPAVLAATRRSTALRRQPRRP